MDIAMLNEVVQKALRKAYRWQTPGNWSTAEWREELVGVAYLACLEAEGEYDPAQGPSLQHYLLQRTLSALLSHYRREWRFASRCTCLDAVGPNDKLNTAPPDPPDPESAAFVNRVCLSVDVRRALSSLTARERQVLMMVFWDGMSERDIAARTGVALSTVCVYKDRALRKLRRAIGY
ncbi:MAG: hypothetical protein KatS3mg022_3409 [Armatimonadota bacterium]|nr:MAG: hypothetical protein KatS3mg022_3409 [Armatimonadota bacterium]